MRGSLESGFITTNYKVSPKPWVEGNARESTAYPLLQPLAPLFEFAAFLPRAVPNLADSDESSDEENEINPRDTVNYTYEHWVWCDTSPPYVGQRVALEKDEHGNCNSCQEEN